MVSVTIPGLYIPEVRVRAGQFLDISLMGVGIRVPPWDVVILPSVRFWDSFTLFDTDWVVKPIISVVDALSQGLKRLADYILGGGLVKDVTSAITGLADFIKGIPNMVISALGDLYQRLYNALSPAIDALRTAIVSIPGTISQAIQDLAKNASQGFGWIIDHVGSALSNWFHSAYDWIKANVADPMGKWFSDTQKWLSDQFSATRQLNTEHYVALHGVIIKTGEDTGKAIEGVWNDLNKRISDVGQAMGENFASMQKWIADVGKEIGTGITQGIQGLGNLVLEALKGVWTWFSDTILKPIGDAIGGAFDAVRKMLENAFRGLIDMFTAHTVVTPEQALPYSLAVALPSMVAGFGIYIAATATDLLHPLKGTGVVPTMIKIVDNLGVNLVTGAIVGSYAETTLVTPLKYYWNMVSRPGIPDRGMADHMLFKGNISLEKWRKIYQYHGFKDEDIEAWYKTMFIEPSDFMLARLYEVPGVPRDWILKKYRERGYTEEDAAYLLEMARRYTLKDEISLVRSKLIADYAEGTVPRSILVETLKGLNLSDEEVSLVVQAAETEYRRKMLKDFIDATVGELKEGFLDEKSAVEKLISQGLDADKAQAIVAKARVQYYKDLRKAKKDTAIQYFRKGMISEDELYSALVQIGVRPDMAAAIVELESIKAYKPPKETQAS